MTDGYQALREGAAVIDLDSRGMIKATGPDRVRLLHAITTNHIEELQPGQGCYTFFLNSQGRIVADAHVFAFEDYLLIDTEPELGKKLYEHIDSYLIADDVEVENVTKLIAVFGIEGPKAERVLTDLKAPIPGESQIVDWTQEQVARVSVTGGPGFRVYLPAWTKQAQGDKFRVMGAVNAAREDVHVVRLENARPRYGEDITESYIPHETQVLHAVHFTKGCYTGQEIVERVRSRGQVNKKLVPLYLTTEVDPGTKLTAEGKEAGVITSSARSPALDRVVALGYVRTPFVQEGQKLSGEGVEAEVAGLAPR